MENVTKDQSDAIRSKSIPRLDVVILEIVVVWSISREKLVFDITTQRVRIPTLGTEMPASLLVWLGLIVTRYLR